MSDIKISNRFAHLNPSQSLGEGIAAGFSAINYRGKIWSLRHGGKIYYFKRPDDGTPLSYLDVVIVGVNPATSRVYFPPGEWEESSASGPLCGSLDGIVPDPGVSVKQAPSCAVCPNNEWITKPGGGRGKNCQEHKRVAVLLRPEMTAKMLGSPIETPIYLKIPPGSLRSLKAYGDSLAHRGLPFPAVVTRISFLPDRLFEMAFEEVRGLTDEEADPVLAVLDAPQTRYILGTKGGPQLAAPVKSAAEVKPIAATSYPAPAPAAAPAKTRAARKPAVVAVAPPPQEELAAAEEETWEEADSDIDAKVRELMAQKVQSMMK